MHKILLITSLITSAFWSAASAGEGSIRGLDEDGLDEDGLDEDMTLISIEVDLEVPDEATVDQVEALLNGPILDALNGGFSTLTCNDDDESGTVALKPFEVKKLPSGRRLGGYKYTTGSCKNCKKNNNRRALIKFENLACKWVVKSAIRQWCKDTADTNNPCCQEKVMRELRYTLSY